MLFSVPGTDETIVSADETIIAPELETMYMYLRDSITMSPEMPDARQTELTATIPNGFIKDGPLGRGWLPFMGHVYWRDVGTWNTDPVRETINLGGTVHLVMYVKGNSGNPSVDCDFIFNIGRAGESDPILQVQVNNVNIPAGTDEPRVFEATSAFPGTNDTTIKAGTAMSLNIIARCNGGGILVFGSQIYKSGFSFDANPLTPQQLLFSKEGAGIEYKDAFLVPWMKLQRIMTINNVPQSNDRMTTDINSTTQARILFWPNTFGPGTYEVVVSLGYDVTGIGNVSVQNIMKITVAKKDFGAAFKAFISTLLTYLVIIIAIIAVLLFVRWQRVKVWKRRVRTLPREDRELPFKKQKAAWKSRNRDETKNRREARVERRRRLEEEEAEKGFALFKRKEQAAPEKRSWRMKRRPKAAPAVESRKLTLEEIGELEL
jgi:hypothetical protein